jgi:hypothetical protein
METILEETTESWYVRINFNSYWFDCIEEARSFARFWDVEFN